MAAPSVASSYATANTTNPLDLPYKPPDLIRNESMKEQRAVPTSDTGRQSRKKRDSDRRRDRDSDSDNAKASGRSKRSDQDERRRSSKRDEKPKRTDSERALDNHRASMVEDQFPGEFPSTFAEPYRPPGLAADYYGDHGESVASQPGVRPVPPSIIIAADQAHLHEATIEAAPPPEPSSLGQVGAAASFYGGTSDFERDPTPKPSKNGKRPSLKPARQSTGGANPRSSPGAEGRPDPVPYSASGVGPAAMAGAGVGASAKVGEASEYFSTQFKPDLTEGGSNTAPSDYIASQGTQNPTQGMQNANQGMQSSTPGPTRPPLTAQGPSSGSNRPTYGAAAAGIAAVGAASYYAGHHTTEEHHSMDNLTAGSYGPQNTGQFPSTLQNYQSQQPMQERRRRRGPFGKIVDFFQDPSAVAEYEAYTEAIGVCKYCFDPGSSPRDAPRKHHYNRQYSDGRYVSSTRVDKLNRYQSSEDEKRRRSDGKKWVATGLAGYGLARMSEAAANRRNDFGDEYSVKSGRPEGSSRVSFVADERVSKSRKTRRSSGDDQIYSPQDYGRESDTKIRKDRRTGDLYEESSSRRRRDSSASTKFSKGAAISAGVAATSLAAAAGHRNRSNSPKKRYYSKRVSPNHSFVDLSATNSGALGLGSFFTSSSANQRKGKKSKGLGFFNFTNASSSSSDADLAFGAGSVRRKKGRRDDGKGRDDGNVNAEILGLAATGVALAVESDRQDRKGKRRADLMVVKEPRNDRSRRHDKRRPHSPPSEPDEGNDDWIDASDDESSIDSALAYGGGLSARQSRESFASNDGTDKWAWRWNNGKRPRKKPSQDLSRFEPAAAGLAGAAVGEAAVSSGRFGPTESTASLQSMQQLDPVPMSDPNALKTDYRASTISPMTDMAPLVFPANTNSAPLQHPQPFAPISQAVYSSQASVSAPMYSPSGPPVFSQYAQQAPITESPKQLPVDVQTQRPRSDEKRRRRRNSSPTPSPIREDSEVNYRRLASTRDSVKFDLTEEQTERDRRMQGRERRRPKREDRSNEKQADSPNLQQEASLEREREEMSSIRRSSTDARTAREQEIERELERLYEEDRRQREARKSKRSDTWPTAAAVGAGVAGVAAVAAMQPTSVEEDRNADREERQSRRKSALKQTTPKSVDDDRSDSQRRRIAQMAATRVKSTPSPVHDDYASYFIPPELADKVKEHNFAARHRDDSIEESAQIVEVAPRTARRKDTFDPFVYRPFGIEPDDDPRKFAWPVPLLDIIEPTPPVSVRGDMSPLPSKSPEPSEVPEVIPEKKQKRSSSVTWGEHRTHEYEVITPLEDHEEFVRTATYESSQPAIDLAERTHSDVKPELSEPVTVTVLTNGVSHSSGEKHVPSPAPAVEAPKPKPNYGQDLEFAAVLAAAAEGAGFDPSIVVNDPTYHRRDSPPGSEGTSFYRSPFTETVSDLGTSHDYSVPPQRGFVEGEIPPTPADEVSKEGLEAGRGQDSRGTGEDEQVDVEPKVPGGFNVFDYLDDSTAEASKPADTRVIKDPVAISQDEAEETRRKEKNRSLEMYTPAVESVKSQPVDWESPKKLTHSSTFDESSFGASLEKSRPSVSYASDPEGFEDVKKSKKKSSRRRDRGEEAVMVGAASTAVPSIDERADSSKRRRKLEREKDDYYENLPPIGASEPGADTSVDSKKSHRKPKRDSDMWDETKSVASSPAELRDDHESGKKSKKKSKTDSAGFDDDTMSVSSLPADLNGDKSSSRKSKDKKSGGLFGFFSSSKSEPSTSQKRSSREVDVESGKRRDTKPEDSNEPKRKSKRKSKDKDLDDVSSEPQRSQSDDQPSARGGVRDQSPEDEFVSSEEAARDNEQTEEGMSFLGERPGMPTVVDGASGSITGTLPDAEQSISAQLPTVLPDPGPSTARSRSVSPRTIPAAIDEHELTPNDLMSPSDQRDQLRQRHLAEIRTSDILSNSMAASSPTAVPLHFRRLPVSPSFARSASAGSVSVGSPMSPLVTPRSRQGRPNSTEFRNSKEFRPLYLVERHSSIKQPEPEVEETYPSLPSSRTSSTHPSMENLRGDDQAELYAEGQMNLSQMRNRRHSFSYWRDDRPTSPDYLDSKTTTPTATEFPEEIKREKPKYEFHSPSELLEDPSGHLAESQEHQSPLLSPMVLPSVGSPESSIAKNESGTRGSRPSSPTREQHSADHKALETSTGLGLVGGAAAALAASQPVEYGEIAEESLPMVDTDQSLSHPSATSATSVNENDTSIDPPTSREIEVSSSAQAANAEFTLQPIPSKKSKKDKKKKRKTLDLADESVEASSSSLDAREERENIDALGARSVAEQLPTSGADQRGQLSDIPASGVSFPPQPVHDVSDVRAPASTKEREIEDLATLATSHADEQALPEGTKESEVPLSVEEINDTAALDEVPSQKAVEEDEGAFSTKKSKKDKKKPTKQKESTSIPQVPGSEVVAPALQGTDASSRNMKIDKPSLTLDKDFTTPEIPSLSVETVDTRVPSDKESMPAAPVQVVKQGRGLSFESTLGAFDETDRTKGLSEMASRESYPFDEPVAAPAVDTAALSRSSALEEAFAKAEAARGTAPGVSEEEALEAFQPPASTEAPLSYGHLDTIVETSREGSKVDLTQVEEAGENLGEDQSVPSLSKSKKDKKKGRQSKMSREIKAFGAEPDDATRDDVWVPTQQETETTKDTVASVEPVETIPIADQSINPFGDDYVPPRKDNVDNKSVDTYDEPNKADASQVRGVSAAATPLGSSVPIASTPKNIDEPAEEFPFAPTSKKDKKGKKGRTSALISDISTPVTEMPSGESVGQTEVRQLNADSFAISTKKGKKGKKKGQVLDWVGGDEMSKPEEVQENFEEPLQKDVRVEQDPTMQEIADNLAAPASKKGKKNKKKVQALDWIDGAATPQTEESIDTATESQRETPLPEAEVEDPTWASTKKSKKDKKKAKKSALLDETPPEIDDTPDGKPMSVPAAVEEQVAPLHDEPEASVPGTLDETSLPREGGPNPRDEAPVPRDEAAVSMEEASTLQEAAPLLQHDLQSSKPAEASHLSAVELHEQQVPEAAKAENAFKFQGIHEFSELHEVPRQVPELVEAMKSEIVPSDGHEASVVRHVREAPGASEPPRQIPGVAQDNEAPALRDPRWASIFGELTQRKASKPAREDQRLVPSPNVEQESRLSEPAVEDHKQVSAPDLERETQPSVPAEANKQIDMPVADTKSPVPIDSVPDPERIRQQMQEQAPAEIPPGQVTPFAARLQAHDRTRMQVNDQPQEQALDQALKEVHRAPPELAAEPLSHPEPERQDIISGSTRELLEHRPEVQELGQAGTSTRVEHPDEAETTANLPQTIVQAATEQADELSSAPARKGKKDKKKSKNKQFPSEELAEPSTETSKADNTAPDSLAAAAVITEAERETLPMATPVEEPSTKADAFSWSTAEKSEDKKKKKSLAFADETSTPASDDFSEGRSSITWPASLAHLAGGTGAEKPTSEEEMVAKDVKVEDEAQSHTDGLSSAPKGVDELERSMLDEVQVAHDGNAEHEVRSQLQDLSSLPKRVDEPSLIPATSEKQQIVLVEDEPVKEIPELAAAQTSGDRTFVAEPVTMQREPDVYSRAATPKKGGKKEKKKRGSVPETSGSATPQTEDEPPLADDTLIPASATTSKTEPTEEDEWGFSTKKGKKDKKKRGSILQTTEPATPQTEDRPPMAEDTVIPAATPKAEPGEEDESAFSARKGKKDKKKKKTALSSLEDMAEPNPEEDVQGHRHVSQAVEPGIDRNTVERPRPNDRATPVVKQEPEELMTERSVPELAKAERFGSPAEREPIVAVPESQVLADPVKAVGSATEREPIDVVPEREAIADQVEEPPIDEDKSILGGGPGLELKPAAATEEGSSWNVAPKQSKEFEEKRKPTIVLGGLLQDGNSPANASDSGERETLSDNTAIAESGPTSGPGHSAEAEAIAETRTIVKPERTAEAEAIAETRTVVKPERTAEAEAIGEIRTIVEPGGNGDEDVSMKTETVDERQQPDLLAVAEPDTTAEDDAWAFTPKKSKRDKKTKRKSVINPEERTIEITSATATAVAAGAADNTQRDSEKLDPKAPVPSELRQIETAPAPSSEPFRLPEGMKEVQSIAEPEEETWGFSTKKNKKDKKKKHQSTFDDYSSTSSALVTPAERIEADPDMILTMNEPAQDLKSQRIEGFDSENPALAAATAQVVQDDFEPTGKKKSKKDKKRKKTLLSWGEDNDTPTEQPTETSTPANEPELGTSAGQDQALERSEEPATVPDTKSDDLGSSQVREPAVVAESILPGAEELFTANEDPIKDLAHSDGRDVAAGLIAVEAEENGQRGFSTTKSKKTKKGKKDMDGSTFTTADDGRRDFDSREEARSRSFSVPGAFEEEPELGSYSKEEPEVEIIEEEQSVLPMTEEPKEATIVANTGDAVEFTTKSGRKGKKGKKSRQSSYLASNETKSDGQESDAEDRGQNDNFGLGIASIAARATSQATGDRSLPMDDEVLSLHEAQNAARHAARYEPTLPHSDHSPELPPILRSPGTRPSQPPWSFTNLDQNTTQEHGNRDSGIQVSDSPHIQAEHLHPTIRDSGYVPSPVASASRDVSTHEDEDAHNHLMRPPRPISPTSSSEDLRQRSHDHSVRSLQPEIACEIDDAALLPSGAHGFHHDESEMLARGHPSPVDSTTKDRSSALFNSSPSNRTDAYNATPGLDKRHDEAPVTDLHRSTSVHGHRSREDLRPLTPSRSPTRHLRQTSDAPILESMQEVSQQPHRSIFGPFPTDDEHDRRLSTPRTPLQTIHEHVSNTTPSNRRRRPLSEVGSPDRGHQSIERSSAPALGERDYRVDAERPINAFNTQTLPRQPGAAESGREFQSTLADNHGRAIEDVGDLAGLAGAATIATEALRPTSRDEKAGDTKSLGNSKSRSTSSKQLRRSQASLENIASSSTHDPVREKGKAAARDMADVYVSVSCLSSALPRIYPSPSTVVTC